MALTSTRPNQKQLIAVIGDVDTTVGFLLGGVGEINNQRKPNFLTVGKDTSVQEIEEAFNTFSSRSDVAIIVINQYVADMIRHVLDKYTKPIPSVLEIPSKDHPYSQEKDSLFLRAKGKMSADDWK